MKKFNQKSESLERYFKSIKKLDPLTKEEELELAVRIQEGDRAALNKLVEHNLKIVITIANKNVVRDHNIPVDDLIQQGNLGLYEAALRFKPDAGVRFASFANLRILKMMNALIDSCGRVVRIPVNQEYQRYLAIKNGEEVENLGSIKLDDFVDSEDSSRSKVDMGIGAVMPDVDETFEHEHFTITTKSLLDTLKPKERQIIELYYGIGYGGEMLTKDIADEVGLTQIRVCQIINATQKKLKKHLETI